MANVDKQRQHAERLLYSMIPKPTAIRLKNGEDPINTWEVIIAASCNRASRSFATSETFSFARKVAVKDRFYRDAFGIYCLRPGGHCLLLTLMAS